MVILGQYQRILTRRVSWVSSYAPGSNASAANARSVANVRNLGKCWTSAASKLSIAPDPGPVSAFIICGPKRAVFLSDQQAKCPVQV